MIGGETLLDIASYHVVFGFLSQEIGIVYLGEDLSCSAPTGHLNQGWIDLIPRFMRQLDKPLEGELRVDLMFAVDVGDHEVQ